MAGGVMYGVWSDKIKAVMSEIKKTAIYPFLVVFSFFFFGLF